MLVLHYSDQEDKSTTELIDKCDVFIATGDLTYFEILPLENKFNTLPAYGVYGNHCTPGYLENHGVKNVNLKIEDLNGIKIGGYQGSPRYKTGGGPQFTEVEAQRDLADFPRVDILLLHAPPFGLLDDQSDTVHTGSKAVREYVDRTQPKFIFCGHISPDAELNYNGTKIYRTHKARLIDINI